MPVERVPAGWRLWAAALLAACTGVAAAQQPPAAQLAACAACHGPEGRSQIATIPSLAGQPRLFIENQLVLIREGLRDVPQMKGLLDAMKDPELVALARYFNEQKPPAAPPVRDPAAYQRGQALAAQRHCAVCHLPAYNGQQQVPRVAAQPEPFLLEAMKQFRDKPGLGRDSQMASALYGLKDAELADLAHYLAHFTPQP